MMIVRITVSAQKDVYYDPDHCEEDIEISGSVVDLLDVASLGKLVIAVANKEIALRQQKQRAKEEEKDA